MPKYHSRKVKVDGIQFDSKREAQRYMELQILEKAGKIYGLRRQVKFQLIPAQYEQIWDKKMHCCRKGKCIERECNYIADFVYYNKEGSFVVEDTKGFRTKDYVIKRKLMLHVHGIRIEEV